MSFKYNVIACDINTFYVSKILRELSIGQPGYTDIDKDGLSSTKFRIVNRKDYRGKHEIIEVVI